MASSITSPVISSAGRNRIEFSPERSVRTPRSKKPFQNSSRVFASGRSKARNSPRPRAAEISRLFALQVAQLIQKICAHFRGVLHQMFFFDDAQKMGRAHHVREISAPGRIQSAGQAKRIVFHFIETRPGHHPAYLRFFSKRQQVGHHIEMFAAPVATRCAHAALHFVEDEKHVVFVANLAQLLQPFAAEMVVAAFALDRLDDDGADVDVALLDEIADLAAPAFCSRSITSASRSDSGSEKSMCGHETRGQSNFANRSVLRGSVLVRLIV